MKVLLINPRVPDTFWSMKYALKFTSHKAFLPPLGLLTVAAMLPEHWQKKVTDMNVARLKTSDIKWADYVLISAMTVQKDSAKDIIRKCRKLNKKIIAGGPLFTAFSQNYPDIDHLVLNEAELTLPDFLSDLNHNKNKNIYTTNKWADIKNSPQPMWELVNLKNYSMMCLQYSRGCPFNCDFCDVTKLFGNKIRTKSTEQIIRELDQLYNNNWRGQVFFVDDNFIGNKKNLKTKLLPEITKWMQKKNYPFCFNTQVSINIADDPNLMKLMVKAGFNCVFIGIESPNEKSLAECNKIQNKNRNLDACIRKIINTGLQVQGGFILGFDNDSPTVFDSLIHLIQNSGIVVAMVGLLNAPPGTKLYQRLLSENRIAKLPTGDNTDCSINFIPKMELNQLLTGYEKVVNTIYSQKYLCTRIKTFLKNYKPGKNEVPIPNKWNLKALIKSILHMGIIEKGRLHYWKLMIWSMKSLTHFRLAVKFTICGYHFRKIFKTSRRQIIKIKNSQ